MPKLTRRRDPEGHQEVWHVYYGDVKVGTIGQRAGVPVGVDQWGWSCGFYRRAPVVEKPLYASVAVGNEEHWRRGQDDLPGRPEAIRRLVEIGLKAKK
jgi:hypothetical protein